jgi:hypothetical protein
MAISANPSTKNRTNGIKGECLMKHGKRLLVFAVVVLFALVAFSDVVKADEDYQMEVVFMQVPDDWVDPHVWSWQDLTWASAFPGVDWPGAPANPRADTPGWFYILVPDFMDFVIVNSPSLDVQTGDWRITQLPVWVVVHGPGEAEISYEQLTEGPIPTLAGPDEPEPTPEASPEPTAEATPEPAPTPAAPDTPPPAAPTPTPAADDGSNGILTPALIVILAGVPALLLIILLIVIVKKK